jgi:lipoprotein-anchoring transpeptidase ErfK/SrfK
MSSKGRYDSIISTLGALAAGTVVFGLLALLGSWIVGSPAQADASPLDPTPTASIAAEADDVTGTMPAVTPAAPTPLLPTPVGPRSVQPTPVLPSEVPPTAAPATVAAGAEGVNVRSGPGTEFAKAGLLSPGAEAMVIGRFGDWWQIDYAGDPAWVASWVVTARYAEAGPEVAAPPAPETDGSQQVPPPAPPGAVDEARWIGVDLSEQTLTAYENGAAVHTTLVSTGLPQTPTPTGQFRIWIKLRYDDMAGADYYIEDVPYVMYFHEGYGLHGVTWHGNFGHPMSHGCVNLPTPEAEWLFNWADVGTLVSIRA